MKKLLWLSLLLIALATSAFADTVRGQASFSGYSVRCDVQNPSSERTLRVQWVDVKYACFVPYMGWETHSAMEDAMGGAEIDPDGSDDYSVAISDSNCAQIANPSCTARVGYSRR